MSVQAMSTAATGMAAQERNIDVVANNLANASTVGFRQQRANFEDLFYQERTRAGREGPVSATGVGVYMGLGTKLTSTQNNFTRIGPLEETGKELDMAIGNTGNSFFAVKIEPIDGQDIAYTRAGNFTRNADGEIILATSTSGWRLEPAITIPSEATSVQVDANGTVTYTTAADSELQEAGQIQLARFANPEGLKPIGGTLFIETEASGAAQSGNPGEEGFGQIQQNFLEGSNVEPVEELITLIRSQRVFEMNSKVITTADEALQTLAGLRR